MNRPGHDKHLLALEAVTLWEGNPDSLGFIGESESYVCGFMASGKKLYLRLTSPVHRNREQIEAELDFVGHLARGGASVSLPVVSISGRAVEIVGCDDDHLFATVFEEADGEIFSFDSIESARSNFRARGRMLGRIHSLSRSFVPSSRGRRFNWDEDPVYTRIESYLPASENGVWAEYHRLVEILRDYPRSNETFGLIHGDFGSPNFRCRGERLTVFDFDDCCYHWYLYDLAVTLYPHGWREGATTLLDALLEGYSEEMPVGDNHRDQIVTFCGLRLLFMFLNHAYKWGLENPTAEQHSWLEQKRENIARGYRLSP